MSSNLNSGVKLDKNAALSEVLNCSVDLLDFSGTRSGTHKMLKAQKVFEMTKDVNAELIAISSGNYARALKIIAEETDRRVHFAISRDAEVFSNGALVGPNTDVVAIEDLIDAKRNFLRKGPFPFSDEVRDLTGDQLGLAYSLYKGEGFIPPINVTNIEDLYDLSRHVQPELYDLGTNCPSYNYIFSPFGSGELLFDLSRNSFKYSIRFIGFAPAGHPAITRKDFESNQTPSMADKLVTPVFSLGYDPFDDNRRSLDRIEIIPVPEEKIEQAHQFALSIGLNGEPSSTISLAIADSKFRIQNKIDFGPRDRVLIINTGNGESFPLPHPPLNCLESSDS